MQIQGFEEMMLDWFKKLGQFEVKKKVAISDSDRNLFYKISVIQMKTKKVNS